MATPLLNHCTETWTPHDLILGHAYTPAYSARLLQPHARPAAHPGQCHYVLQVKFHGIDEPGHIPFTSMRANPLTKPYVEIQTVDVVAALFELLHIDANPQACVTDGVGVEISLRAFEQELRGGDFPNAMSSLSNAVSYLSTSIQACKVQDVNMKLDALAGAIKFAKISTAGLDRSVNVLIGTSDMGTDIEAIAHSVSAADSQGLADALGKTMSDFFMITGGCSSTDKACNMVNGVLSVFQEVARDFGPCKAAILPIVATFESAASAFESKNYKTAVKGFAGALDKTSQALLTRACGLPRIGNLIAKLSPKLATAVVKVQSNGGVKIVVKSADVYNALYLAVKAVKSGDYNAFGVQMGSLLRVLRTSSCTNAACSVLEGLLASMQLEASNVDQCLQGAQHLWNDVKYAVSAIEQGSLVSGVKLLGNAIVSLSNEVKACKIPQLAQIAQKMLTKLNHNTIATDIGNEVALLSDGADITLQIRQAMGDYKAKDYNSFGTDLGNLAQQLGSSKLCKSIACEVVEGILGAGSVAFKSLKACSADLKKAESSFVAAVQQFENSQFETSIQSFASGLNIVAAGVKDCGLSQEMGYMIQEANVLGLANATSALGNGMQFLVHGADFYQEIYSTVQDVKRHDWRGAGANLQQVMSQLNAWTGKFACRSPACYVVIGMLQFLGDIQGSIKECESDFKLAQLDFTYAYTNCTASHNGIGALFHMSQNKADVRQGVKSLGLGIQAVGEGIGACHLADFADILAQLAVKLGVVPEVLENTRP